ncbi:hypothetical protein, partial [Enterobacter asburiae]
MSPSSCGLSPHLRTIETLLLLSERQLPVLLTVILQCSLLLDGIKFPEKGGTWSRKLRTCVVQSGTGSY